MKVILENFGVLKRAEFELGELTLICGGNNTGKTYATYALYGFLRRRYSLLKVAISDQCIHDLIQDGIARIDIEKYALMSNDILRKGCDSYIEQLSKVFASKPDQFKNTKFEILFDIESISSIKNVTFESKVESADDEHLFSLSKSKGEKDMIVSRPMKKSIEILPPRLIKDIISTNIIELFFEKLLRNPFIASTERTGAAMFYNNLDLFRIRLFKEIVRTDEKLDRMKLLSKPDQEYPLPVENNIDFLRRTNSIEKENSFLAEKHPEVLNDFADILGGEYIHGKNNTIYFKPLGKQIKLTMLESSSAVRSLLLIGLYLYHVAKPGDLLMVDEPELNLHPENQRRMARLFARLVNLGIHVFVTTHSDYIVKELNTLIMLNQDRPHLKQIAQQENYQTQELIDAQKIRVFFAEEGLMKLENNKRRSRCQTLVPAKIDPKMGIEARSFDKTIDKMNNIQKAILWGEITYE